MDWMSLIDAEIPHNRGQQRLPVRERFWRSVTKTPTCWIWIACRTPFGHGLFTLTAPRNHKKRVLKSFPAHRMSWILKHGPIPKGNFVLHKCDNPPCVNPDHLFLGTQADNIHDAMRKGRWAMREAHGFAKLTEIQVAEIRKLISNGKYLHREIGKQYGVSRYTITDIANNRSWKIDSNA